MKKKLSSTSSGIRRQSVLIVAGRRQATGPATGFARRRAAAPLLLFSLSLTACCGKTTATMTTRDRSHESRHLLTDTLLVSDSIRVIQRADTVYVDRWHLRYQGRLVHQTDTVRQFDTIRVTTTTNRSSASRSFTRHRSSTRRSILWLTATLLAGIVVWKWRKEGGQ